MSLLNGLKGAIKGAARARALRTDDVRTVDDTDHMYCTTCGHSGETKTVTPGSIWIELVLWLCFIIPGLIYSAWRHNKRHEACENCDSPSIIPSNSPRARKAMRE